MPLEKLDKQPYASVICYPKPSKAELRKRLKELQGLGVTALEFRGEKEVLGVPVLGKGCVGIVTIACRNVEKVALKIRRVDADRARMQEEAVMLKKANAVNVGPTIISVSKDFLLMQFIDGALLPKWLEKNVKKARLRRVLREILDQCWRLDKGGLDHGELSHARKHIIINDKDVPILVDFESASLKRKPANVTSICQFLFISSWIARKLTKELGGLDEKAIIGALKRYKIDGARRNLKAVLKACRL